MPKCVLVTCISRTHLHYIAPRHRSYLRWCGSRWRTVCNAV